MKLRQRKNLWVPAAVALTALGCQGGTEKTGSTGSGGGSSTQVVAETSGEQGNVIHVTLKVPNMTWAGCPALVQRDLEKIDGITNIKTDRATRTASFTLTKPDVDYKAKLEEFAKTNSKLRGYQIQ